MNESARAFVHRQVVQFVDTDMAGIVHFSNFFRYMEAAEDAFLKQVGVALVDLSGGKHVSLPRLSARCDYRSPARYGDVLDITVTVKELRDKTIRYSFHFSIEGRLVAEGEVLAIYCEVTDQLRSVRIPDPMRQSLSGFIAHTSPS